MEKSISVNYKRVSNGEMVNIPVAYWLERENERVTVFNYKIDLPEHDTPDWLTRKEFSVRQVYSPGNPGVTSTDYGGVFPNNTEDMAGLTQVVHSQVEFKEKI